MGVFQQPARLWVLSTHIDKIPTFTE